MPKFAGIHHRDLAPIPIEERARFSRVFSKVSRSRFQVYEDRAILLAFGCMPDHSLSEHLAVGSETGNVIGWDGRLDNRDDLLKRFGNRLGEEPKDPAIALALYETAGLEALRDLIGDWSLVLWDRRTCCLLLASDYAGVRPLYYRQSTRTIEWSSLLADFSNSGATGDLDRDYVAEFLLRGASRHRTPYPDVQAVPPGHVVCVHGGSLSVRPFWKIELMPHVRDDDPSGYEEQFQILFRKAVQARLRSTKPVHSELSGGLDSSSITVTGQTLIQEGSVPAPELISVSYRHSSSQDEPYFRLVEKHCGIQAIHLNMDDYPYISEDSTGDAMPAWWSSRQAELARRLTSVGSSVLMTGQLGDLITGNWLDDSDQVADQLGRGGITTALKQAFAWSQALHVPVYSIVWRAIRMNMAFRGDVPPLGGETCVRSDSSDSLTAELQDRVQSLKLAENADSRWRGIPPGRRKLLRALASMLEDRRLQTPEGLQPVCYTHPFADRRLVEFMLTIPAGVVCGPGEPRRLMRRALTEILPPPILKRRSKATFNAVFTGALKPLAAKLVQVSNLMLSDYGYVDSDDLKLRLNRFLHGLDCNESHIRHAILLECWLRQRAARPLSRAGNREYRCLSTAC
jgi:asparagine synthase (glutamine-hydrolysing)